MRRASLFQIVFVLLSALCGRTLAADSIQLWDLKFVPQQLPAASHGKALASADVNEDGHVDLIIAQSRQNEVAVYLGNADGEFKQARHFPAGPAPSHFTVTDIDRDGHLDLVIANHETSYITLLCGDGQGAFVQAPNSPVNLQVDPHPHVAHAYDMNGDNTRDLIIDSRTDRGFRVLEGTGEGEFRKPGKLVDMDGDPYLGVAVGDINGDNRPDLLSPNEASIAVALNTGADDISFRLAQPIGIRSPFALALPDMDADGKLDLVVATDGQESSVRILKGDGRGNFKRLVSPMPIARGAKGIAVGDINGDGADDLMATSWSSNEIIIVSGRDPSELTRLSLTDIENPWGAIIADLNGDGYGDLTIADGIKPVVKIYMSRSVTTE